DGPGAVREREPAGDADRELDGLPDRQRPALLDDLLERVPVDVLEHDELPAVLLAAVDHRDDVRVRELRDRARLAAEALDRVAVLRVVRVQDLQRDVALEQPVARPKDTRHPAAADELLELVSVRNDFADHGHGEVSPSSAVLRAENRSTAGGRRATA